MIPKRPTPFRPSPKPAARGSINFTRDDAVAELGLSRGAFLDAAERLQKQGQLLRPRNGAFYVMSPPNSLNWGAPPPRVPR